MKLIVITITTGDGEVLDSITCTWEEFLADQVRYPHSLLSSAQIGKA